MINSEYLRLLALNSSGRVVLDIPFSKKALSFAGSGEPDHLVSDLHDNSVFISAKTPRSSLMLHEKGGTPVTLPLDLGRPLLAGGVNWLMTLSHQERSAHSQQLKSPETEVVSHVQEDTGAYLSDVMEWLGRPMDSTQELRDSLRLFLRKTISAAAAINGMLVLVGEEGFDLIASEALSPIEAEEIWNKMPRHLTEEILRSKARIILPDGLREKTGGKSTVFIKNLRSIVGFPVLAEGRVVAIFYLGYRNLISELSLAWQNALELSSQILGIAVQRALLREEMNALKTKINTPRREGEPDRAMIGHSTAIANVYKLISRLANFSLPVLVIGETGTGKELVVRELHRFSDRGEKSFVAVNAAALPENLIEAELFGHKKGAFTGALSDRAGLIEQADAGTLFIDEIGELPLTLQAKLLRVLQEKCVTRLGENKSRPVDFRLVAATHRDLKKMVSEKLFREDLYFRIAGSIIELPPLRERREDILPLAKYFVSRFAKNHSLQEKEFSRSAIRALEQWAWPGNIRELENCVQRSFVMSEGPVIERDDLGLESSTNDEESTSSTSSADLATARDEWMKNYISDALKRNNGNRADTAKDLGVGQRTLFRYLDSLNIRGL